MAIAFFILGHAASGKTKLSKEFIKYKVQKNEHWCLVDKDTCGEILSNQLMISYGLDPNDRDSPRYKENVRDLEYSTALAIAKEQLKLGINVVLPGPWNKEIREEIIFDAEKLNLPKDTILKHIYLDITPEKTKERILKRNKERDQWKLKNWEIFSKTLILPQVIVDRKIPVFNNNADAFEFIKNYK